LAPSNAITWNDVTVGMAVQQTDASLETGACKQSDTQPQNSQELLTVLQSRRKEKCGNASRTLFSVTGAASYEELSPEMGTK